MSDSRPPVAPWLVQSAVVLTGALLGFNIVVDALSDAYEGYGVTFALIGLFGGLLGIHKTIRGGDDK